MAGKKKKISITGCGAIGTQTAIAILSRFSHEAELVSVTELDNKRKKDFDRKVSADVPNLDLDSSLQKCDLMIETASASVVPELLEKSLEHRKDLLVMSVGGLLGQSDLISKFRKNGLHLCVPSGAIAGLDLLRAACMSNVYRVEVITKKPTEALKGAPYILQENIDLDQIMGEQVVFEGKASDAVKAFPQNINVAATLSLAGIGSEKTRVKIITSRLFKKNTHEISIEGDFGKFHAVIENEPSRSNPKTSQLAILSCIAALEKILNGISVGT